MCAPKGQDYHQAQCKLLLGNSGMFCNTVVKGKLTRDEEQQQQTEEEREDVSIHTDCAGTLTEA